MSTMFLSAPQEDPMAHGIVAPPDTPRQEITEILFGKQVSDPYRWLEDLDDEKTVEWARKQDAFARQFLNSKAELLNKIKERVAVDGNAPDMGVPLKRGNSLFYMFVSREYENPVLMHRNLNGGSAKVVIDPGKDFVVADFRPDAKAQTLAYALENKDSGEKNWYFLDMKAGTLLSAKLTGGGIHGNPWWPDGKRFVYFIPPSGEEGKPGQIRLLNIQGNEGNELLFESENPAARIRPDVTEDGKYLAISIWEKTNVNRVFVKPLPHPDHSLVELFAGRDGQHTFLGSIGATLFFLTTHGSPKGKVVAITLTRDLSTSESTIVEESENTLTEAYFFNGRLLAVYLENGFAVLKIFNIDKSHVATLHPPKGLLWNDYPVNWPAFSGGPDSKAYFRSLALMDAGVYEIDMRKGELHQIFERGHQNQNTKYLIRQVFFSSQGGTKVPMTILHKADLKLEKKHPVLINVYGAYGFTFIPFFNPMYRVFVEAGGIYAVPNIRGGGIYGQDWYEAGRAQNKMNSVQDTIFAAKWFLDNGYAVPKRLAVTGNSAGTIPSAVAAITNPELFGAVLLEVPLSDMIRYRLWTGSWNSEFASPESLEGFEAARKVSPYHLLEERKSLPPVMITAGDQDETARVSHAYKLAAALQHAQTGEFIPLLHIDWGTGHGSNKTKAQRINTWTYELAFLFHVLGMNSDER
ncbi:prolyl oligopeptidase family serine peptidase [bacterium]|nr:prolyl oligopeptidase family serine peptidase [bacterium]MCI0606346.1 prolyl oligopeptidase family serine peptidase [bacterium]